MKYRVNSGYYFSQADGGDTVRCVSVQSTDMIIYEFDDEVAITLINSLKSEATFEQICRVIENEFEVEGVDFKQDIQDFLDEMVDKGIFDQIP